MIDTKQTAAQLRQMDQTQAEEALRGCTKADLRAIAKELNLRLPGNSRKVDMALLIAKQVGYRDLHKRIQNRPSTIGRMP